MELLQRQSAAEMATQEGRKHPMSHGDGRQDSPAGSRRGTLWGEMVFAGSALRLITALLADVAYNISCAFVFIVVRRSCRARMRRIILSSSGSATLGLATFILGLSVLAAGCSTESKGEGARDAWSFQEQIEETKWSARVLIETPDAKKSLEDDLQAYSLDPKWAENLHFDVTSLFLTEDATKSLESDLKDFGDEDFKQHGLSETFRLWGW